MIHEKPTGFIELGWFVDFVDLEGKVMIEGGCFCRQIRYVIEEGSYRSVNCHCTICRRIHAAPFVSWLVVPAAQFRYVSGEPTELRSSTGGTRYFCDSCGTHVVCVNTGHPDIVDVAIGSLDRPEAFAPSTEIFTDTRLHWAPGNQR